jgi:hypothetical protein
MLEVLGRQYWIVESHDLLHAGRDLAEHFVAGEMAIDVVGSLEPIEVEEQDGGSLVLVRGTIDYVREDLMKGTAIGKIGERVGRRERFEQPLAFLFLRNVDRDADDRWQF